MTTLAAGTIIGDYTITQELGRGILGITYGAEQTTFDPKSGQPTVVRYVVQTLDTTKIAEAGLDPNVTVEELLILKQVSQEAGADNYMAIYHDYFTQTIEGVVILFIITDYIKGDSLSDYILGQAGATPAASEPLESQASQTSQLLDMFLQMAQAVQFIHSHGVAHQNIKPSNIKYDTTKERLKLIDFSESCSTSLNNQCKGKAGTAYYMPPELLSSPVDPSKQDFKMRAAHDIWSLGVVFYQLANPEVQYMNFTSNDPEIIMKDIQIQAVIPSQNAYEPINDFIMAILNKDYTRRPTAAQTVELIEAARPSCKVNEILYNREQTEGILTVLGLDVDPKDTDFNLCRVLTDHLEVCKLNNNSYQKEQLENLAELLGVQVPEGTSSVKLCNFLQESLRDQQGLYAGHVTNKLIRAIDYMAQLQIAAGNGKNAQILAELKKKYDSVYAETKKLDLVDLNLLEERRKALTIEALAFEENAGKGSGSVYALQANYIIDVILENNPTAEVGGLPLARYKFT